MTLISRIAKITSIALSLVVLLGSSTAFAELTITSGTNATTTPNVATSITGFQIVGPSTDTTPVKLLASYGTLAMGTTTGLTFTGSPTGSVLYFSGTVANINAALATLTYTRASTGSDTLEISLVPPGEAFSVDNGHLYKFIESDSTWDQALVAATQQTLYGVTGYLATITSADENAFISGRLTGDGWIGASDSATEGDWKWMAGPEAGTSFWLGTDGGSAVGGRYSNWSGGEPNQSGDEDCAQTYVASGSWNDLPCDVTLSGYVVEFGTDGNLPAVVARNISVTTADVPAVLSLVPANAVTTVLPSANLVIRFTKSVTVDTGNILIKKAGDDSVAESIAVNSGAVTGSGTDTITINPTNTLEEGVAYYVIIPNTAFKDSSNNHFEGISSTTTWTFTTTDVTAPIVSAIATAVATTNATITWTTNELASSHFLYGTDAYYINPNLPTDTAPRVLSHTKSFSGLYACTTYRYKIVTTDGFENTTTTDPIQFTTQGCDGTAIPASVQTKIVAPNGAYDTTLIESGRTLMVTTPSNFTTTASMVVVQVHSLDAQTVYVTAGTPAGVQSSAAWLFDIKLLLHGSTPTATAEQPVTIQYSYTDADVAGLDRSTLALYHYHDDEWVKLEGCTVNNNSNTITCTTTQFSVFGIFGARPVSTGTSGVQFGCKDPKATNYNYFAKSQPSLCTYTIAIAAEPVSSNTATTTTMAVRDLTLKMKGADVLALQKLLNAHNFILAKKGEGAPGKEVEHFGQRTRSAVRRFQKAHGVTPTGYFGVRTRTAMTKLGWEGLWW